MMDLLMDLCRVVLLCVSELCVILCVICVPVGVLKLSCGVCCIRLRWGLGEQHEKIPKLTRRRDGHADLVSGMVIYPYLPPTQTALSQRPLSTLPFNISVPPWSSSDEVEIYHSLGYFWICQLFLPLLSLNLKSHSALYTLSYTEQ